MRLVNLLLIVVLTVNAGCCDDTIAISTTKPKLSNDSCTLKNISDTSPIGSLCDNQTFILFFKDSHFYGFPPVFEYYPNLRSLDISNAGIQDIDMSTFNNAGHLTSLYAYGSNMSIIPNYLFSHANNLTCLDLGNSSIVTVEKYAFEGLSNLMKLDLSDNKIKHLDGEMFQPLYRLETIRLMDNKIEIISADLFALNNRLKWAYFSSNKIFHVERNSFLHTQLKLLDLGFNELLDVDVSTLKYLKTLTVANNRLNTLIVPPNCEEIHAENNTIAVINSEEVNQLLKLFLSSNYLINTRNLSNFAKLEVLDLSSNHFRTIEFADLKSLIKLKELRLTGNKLSEIKIDNVVANLPNLKMIELSTKHWSDVYVNQLKVQMTDHKIELFQNRDEFSENDARIIPPSYPEPSTPWTKIIPTTTRPSVTFQPYPDSVEEMLHKIDDRLNDIEDGMAKSNSANEVKYDALVSTFKTFEILLMIMFIVGLMVVLYKVIMYSNGLLNGMRFRRAQSSNPIFSEQDL
jgi:Leucine-rich repeat (LRR) protein